MAEPDIDECRYSRMSIGVALASTVLVLLTAEFSFEALGGIRNGLFIEVLQPYGPIFISLNALTPLILLGAVALLFMHYYAAATREAQADSLGLVRRRRDDPRWSGPVHPG